LIPEEGLDYSIKEELATVKSRAITVTSISMPIKIQRASASGDQNLRRFLACFCGRVACLFAENTFTAPYMEARRDILLNFA
jgi:hypothetical protein